MSDPTAPAADSGIASLDQVLEERKERTEPDAVETQEADPEPEIEAEPTAETEPAAEEPSEEPAEDSEAEEPIAAPHSWDAEAKARFAELPKDVQTLIVQRETARDGAVAKAQQEAAEARKQAAGLGELAQQITTIAEQAKAAFERPIPELGVSWEQIDWRGWFAQDPQTASVWKARYDTEREELQRVSAAQQQASARAFQAYVSEQAETLKTKAPELLEPAKRQDVAQYLLNQGYAPDQLASIGAADLIIAHKAMLYDRADRAVKAAPPKKDPAPAPKVIKPQAAQSSSQSQRVAELEARASRTGDLDDVLAARRARQALKG